MDWFEKQVADAKSRVAEWPEHLRGEKAISSATLPDPLADNRRIATLERELSEAKERVARLRAHIQEAADSHQKALDDGFRSEHRWMIPLHQKRRDHHLAALNQQEKKGA